jgi:hypothetical protein
MQAASVTPTAPPPFSSSTPGWARDLERRLLTGRPLPTDRFWATPELLLSGAGYRPDAWQAEALRRHDPRTLFLCSRQSGKSLTAGAIALREALLVPDSTVLLLSPTERQSGEIFRAAVLRLYNRLGRPVPAAQESALQLALQNGSRIIALPGQEMSVRCYSSVALLVIDEAARVADDLYRSVRPMLAVSGGRLIALSTPYGKRGWFYEAWGSGEAWCRVKVPASLCPRITAAFLAEERAALGERWFRQEYGCSFEDVVGALLSSQGIAAMFRNEGLLPLFDEWPGPAGVSPFAGPDDLQPLFAAGEL